MKINVFLITTIFTCLFHFTFSQEKSIKGTLESTKLVNVEVMNLKPKGRNKVAMIFRAETLEGEPA